MTRDMFGVSTFVANMTVKQNALDTALQYHQAVTVVKKSFYVNDDLTGVNSIEDLSP